MLRKSSFIKECHLTHKIRLIREWKSWRIENKKDMNKWRDKKDFIFLYLYLVGGWKSGEIKNKVCINLLSCLYNINFLI